AYGPQNDVTLKMPAFEWVHVQLHQQKGMISLSPPTICNSALITAQLTRFDHHNIAIDILLPCVFAFLSTGIAFLYLGYSLHLMLVA
ncbi:hypothetical protein, partial [Shigella sonnei]|uniref:hypothetical protein n=1 Tax=Shigella sonnei TaxID=624 RepID=UPI001C0A7A45